MVDRFKGLSARSCSVSGIFNRNCVNIIESTNRNCPYNPLIDAVFLNGVLQLFSSPQFPVSMSDHPSSTSGPGTKGE